METEPAGFSIVPSVFSAEECAALIQVVSSLRIGRAGARNLLGQPAIAAAAHDPRLVALAEAAVGGRAVPYRVTLFNKTAGSNWLVSWHQDRSLPLARRFEAQGWGPWSVKQGVLHAHAPSWALAHVIALRLHLDPSHEGNGPLRVIPGTHLGGALSQSDAASFALSRRFVSCVVGLGGVIAMRPLLLHSSPKATSSQPRRVLHIEYAPGLQLSHQALLAVA